MTDAVPTVEPAAARPAAAAASSPEPAPNDDASPGILADPPVASLFSRVRDFADAAVDIVEPLFGRKTAGRRWVFVESGDDFAVHDVRKGRARLASAPGTAGGPGRWQRGAARAGDVELRLNPDKIITRRMSLPIDGRSFLSSIIDHRLDRLTPWKPENVLYGYAVAGEHKAEGLIDVDFAATSREIAAHALARLERLGIVPTAIGSAADPVERAVPIDLLRGTGDRRRLGRRRRIRRFLLAAAPALVALYAATLVLAEVEAQRLDDASRALASRRLEMQASAGGSEAERAALSLIEAKRQRGAAFLLIDRLAGAIPSDTFLTDLEIRPGSLRLRGSSRNAPALIPVLEDQPDLESVRFEAPVARDADGRDRFDIVATIVAGDGAETP